MASVPFPWLFALSSAAELHADYENAEQNYDEGQADE